MSLIVLVYKNDWESEYFVADEQSPAVRSLLRNDNVLSEVIFQRAFPEQEDIILEHYQKKSNRFHFTEAGSTDWYLSRTVA